MTYIRTKKDFVKAVPDGAVILRSTNPDCWQIGNDGSTIDPKIASEAMRRGCLDAHEDGLLPGHSQTYVAKPGEQSKIFKPKKPKKAKQNAAPPSASGSR